MATLYDELGLTSWATDEEIHSAYRRLARQFHPDRNAGFETQAKERFQRIQQAFELLSNPATREKYDESLGPARFAGGPLSVVTPLPEININRSMQRKQTGHRASVVFFSAAAIIAIVVIGLICFNRGEDDKQLAERAFQQSQQSIKAAQRPDKTEGARTSSPADLPRSQELTPQIRRDAPKSTTTDNRDELPGNEPIATTLFPRVRSSIENGAATEEQAPANRPQVQHATIESQEQSSPLLKELITALDAGSKEKVTAAVKSLRAADPRLSGVRPIVDRLMPVAEGNSGLGRRQSVVDGSEYSKVLWVFSEAGNDSDWILDCLLSIQSEFNTHDQQSEFSNAITHWYSSGEMSAKAVSDAEIRHEVTRLLAEFHAKDQRAAQLFAKRVEQLKSAPQPNDRAVAALWLSRSMALSDVTVPALLDTVKKDTSLEVKRAAILSLSGFHAPANPVTAVVDKGIEYFKDGTTQFILMASLASVDSSESSQFKRAAVNRLLAYKSKTKKTPIDIYPACKVLECLGTKANWAIPQLLGAAEMSLFKDQEKFEFLTTTLLRVGSDDERVLKFYERAAKEGPENHRVYCDSVAKQLKLQAKR